MARDTKLRMSIDENIVKRLDELKSQLDKALDHKPNKTKLAKIEFPIPDTNSYIMFNFFGSWTVGRYVISDTIWTKQDENSWEICKDLDGKVKISTYGKMAVDINREIEEWLIQVQVEIDNIENPIYCPECGHCGETGCCGFIAFLEKHVRGKTNCLYEQEILNDLEEWIRSEDD